MSILVDDLVCFPSQAEPDAVEASLSEAGLSIVGADFGESKKSGTLVKTSVGVVMVDREPETRTIGLKLEVRSDADVTLPEAAARLEAIVGEMHERNTWIRRDFHIGGDFGSLLYHVSGEVTFGDFAGWQVGASPDVTLTMVCDYAAYSTEEVEHGPFKTTAGQRQLVYELPASSGTTKGLKRVRVTNEGEEDLRGLIWSEESRYYKPGDPTAEPVYLAKSLTPKGGAEVKTVEGAEVVQHAGLTAGRIAILGSKIAATGHMTHRGPRRMWMRLEQPSGSVGDVKLQLLWRALGSSRWVEDNAIISPYVVGGYCLVDLGECRPQEARIGDERWEWVLTAWAPAGSGSIRVRDVYPLSTEQFLKCYEPYEPPVAEAQSTKSPGSVTSPNPSYEWTTPGNAKASDNSYATKKVTGVATVSAVALAKSFGFAIPESSTITGVLVKVERHASLAIEQAQVRDQLSYLHIAGAQAGVGKAVVGPWPTTDAVQTYGGAGDLWGLSKITPAQANSSEFGFEFAAGLSSIKSALSVEAFLDAITMTVYYVEAEGDDRVCFASRAVDLSSDGCSRQHPEDDVWGSLVPDGFLPYDSLGGPGERSARGILIASAGDLKGLADSATTNLGAEIYIRPAHHYARIT